MGNKAILLVIDPQRDFCEKNGHLSVSGEDADISRLAKMVSKYGDRIDDIHVTLDSHQWVHIAHPVYWINSNGDHPDPYTVISADDVKSGKWRAMNPHMQQWAQDYVDSLKSGGRYALCVWPPHCLIGTVGATVMPELASALIEWEMNFRKVHYVPKGTCLFTEHYSAVKADVEYAGDPTTMLNSNLISMLKSGSDILICGEALDFCVANTIRDIAAEFSDAEVARFVLLEDASSPVNAPGLEHLAKQFITDMTARGMRISTTDTYFN